MVKLDKKDRKILYELSENARLSATKIAGRIGLGKDTTVYRINRLKKEGVVKRLIALINTENLGFTRYELHIQLKNVDQEKESEIANFLAQHPMFLWVRSALGEYDMLTEFYASDIYDYEKTIQEIKNKYSKYIQKIDSSVVLAEYSFPLKLIGYKNEEPIASQIKKERIKADKTDFLILKEVANNARESVINISQKARINPDSVIYRIKNLIKNKMIVGYRAVINEKILGLQKYKVLLKLRNVNEEITSKILGLLKNSISTQYIKPCIGEWDFSITLLAKDIDEFRKIIFGLKNNLKESLEEYIPLVLFEEHKNTYFPEGIVLR